MADPLQLSLEMAQEPRFAQEQAQKARALPEGHLVKLVEMQKQEALAATKDLREGWLAYFKLWLNEIDFSDKEDWQVKLWVPKPFSSVEQSSAIIHRAMMENPDTYAIDSYSPTNKPYIDRVWMPLVKMHLNNAGFVPKYVDGAKMGFITGVAGYFKLRVVDLRMPPLMPAEDLGFTSLFMAPLPQSKSFITIDIVPPWNIYRDPESRARQNYSGTYIYHSEYKDRSYLQAMSQVGWDRAKIAEILATKSSMSSRTSNALEDVQIQMQQLKQYTTFQPHELRQQYLVDEGWLDVLDENGEIVFPDALMIHCNKKILLGPMANPIWAMDENTGRKKWPLIAGAPIVHPFRFEGRGIVEQNAPFAALFSNTFMLMGDAMNWMVHPGTEIYQNALVDQDDLSNPPGKLWKKHTAEQALRTADIGRFDLSGALAFLQFADRERQNSDFTTDFALGLPGSRSEITKGEVQIKTGQSLAIFEMMGRNLEVTGKDLVELAFDLCVQFSDPRTNPQIAEVLDPGATQWLSVLNPMQRQEILQGNYIYTFTGLSNALQKADHLQRMIQLATLVGAPQYAPYINPSQIIQVITELLGLTSRIDVYPTQMVTLDQAKQAVTMAIQQTAQTLMKNQGMPQGQGMLQGPGGSGPVGPPPMGTGPQNPMPPPNSPPPQAQAPAQIGAPEQIGA